MAFYVRKINSVDNLKLIQDTQDISFLEADILKNEFSTTGGTLSTWKIESQSELKEAVLATAICFKQLSDMYFLLINDSFITSDIDIKPEASGHYLCEELEQRHYNIKNINVGNIKNSILLIKSAIQNENLDDPSILILQTAPEIQQIIKNAYVEKKITKDDIEEPLYNYLKKRDKDVFKE